jgi:hypothetical protein
VLNVAGQSREPAVQAFAAAYLADVFREMRFPEGSPPLP